MWGSETMGEKAKQELKEIYYNFYYNRLKASLVATGTNIKYQEIEDSRILQDIRKVIEQYSLENIFMGQGINMLVSSFETFLKDIFIFLASSIDSIEKEIRSNVDQNNKFEGSIKDLIEKKKRNFSFQNLVLVSNNYEVYIQVEIREIFNETGARFKHNDEEEQKRIEEMGFFEYFNKDIWELRHKITHASEVPEYGKEVWGVCFNTLNIIGLDIIKKVENNKHYSLINK